MSETLSARAICAVAAMSLFAACSAPTKSSTETEAAICEGWAETLFRPSRQDTEDTAILLTRQHTVHAAYCGASE